MHAPDDSTLSLAICHRYEAPDQAMGAPAPPCRRGRALARRALIWIALELGEPRCGGCAHGRFRNLK